MCGGSDTDNWTDKVYDIDVTFPHTAATVAFKMTSTLDEASTNESWGFREFKLFVEPNDDCAVFFSECNY